MLFRLALAMGRTLKELREVLSYAEFQEWCLYYQIEPWGESRADLRAGIVASTLANIYMDFRGVDEKYKPADFMPYLDKPEPELQPVIEQELTDEQLAAWADAAIYGIPPGGSE